MSINMIFARGPALARYCHFAISAFDILYVSANSWHSQKYIIHRKEGF